MTTIKKNCLHCTKEFNTRSQDVKRGHGKFCSRKCSSDHNKGRKEIREPNVICAFCHQEFYMAASKLSNSKSGLYFCCRAHKDQAQKIGGITAIMPSHYGIESDNTYRRIAFAVKPKVCERCGYDKHEAGIVVHHKDHNRQNNDITNLEVLCAICHAIEHWGQK